MVQGWPWKSAELVQLKADLKKHVELSRFHFARGWYNIAMAANLKTRVLPARIYMGPDISMRVIRRYARQVAERFHPEMVFLFGSFASGTPHADSDVDLLVIMPCRNELDMSVKISWEVPAPFPMDLLVRQPAEWEWRTREKESFATEILTNCQGVAEG